MKDIHNVWDGNKFAFTLNKIAAITGIPIPECFAPIADNVIADMTESVFMRTTKKTDLRVYFIYVFEERLRARYIQYIKEGAIVVSSVPLKDESGQLLPMILLPSTEDVHNAWHAIGRYMKTIIPMPTIGITGSIGKTTLTLFMQNIFSERYKVFVSGGNLNNAALCIRQMFRSYDPSYGVHVQECGGGFPTCVERASEVLQPDAFVVSNVLPHHIDKYKSIEGVLKDKTSFDLHTKDEAFGVINIDDDLLRNHTYKHRIVTCGIEHTEADYVAKNIHFDTALHLDVVHNGESVPLTINVPGLHNAYNALLAFATAKESGLTNEEIQNGLKKYQSGDIRQSLRQIAGRTLYIDCFNICADSIRSCLATLDAMTPRPGGRRIAVLGGENGLGSKLYAVNYDVGLGMSDYKNVDEFIFLGPPLDTPPSSLNLIGDAHAVYEGAKRVLRYKKVSFFDNMADVAEKIVRETHPGDIILFKGIFRYPFFSVIDRAFGTSYTHYSPYTSGKLIHEGSFSAIHYDLLDGCNIYNYSGKREHLQIPSQIAGKPIHRIGKQVFENRTDIKSIDFGRTALTIGSGAFKGCTSLRNLDIPSNIIMVESYAFADCTELEHVKLSGVEHVESGAFQNCSKLATVEFSQTCCAIEEDAFKGSENLTIVAPQNSYAMEYARVNGFKTRCL